MKLLVFYPYIPYPLDRGAYHRTFHLLRELARSHEVDLVALAERCQGVEFKPVFAEFCRRVEFIPFEHPPWDRLFPKRLLNPLPSTIAHWALPHAQQVLGRLLATERYAAVQICDIVLAQYFLGQNRAWPLVVDRTRVDLQYQLMEHRRMKFPLRTRILNSENYLKLWFYERAVAKRAMVEVVCGADDATFLRRYIRQDLEIKVIPNGVDLDYFQPLADPSETRNARPTLLFCGAMDYNPNIDALRWYFSEMHDRLRECVPDLGVIIAGKDPVEEVREYAHKPQVTVTGAVPDVRPYYRQAWVQIVPLRIGGGTRLKIVESLALGTPVVSTTMGAQGLGLRHEHDILLADAAGEFVRQTAKLLQEPGLRACLERNGLETVRTRLSWRTLGQKLVQIYARTLPLPAPVSCAPVS